MLGCKGRMNTETKTDKDEAEEMASVVGPVPV